MAGESLDILSRRYNTTPATIQAINNPNHPLVWAGFVVILLPGVQTPDPAWPIIQPYQVLDKQVAIDDLAARLKVNAALLRHYNACAETCQLYAGDWAIIPSP